MVTDLSPFSLFPNLAQLHMIYNDLRDFSALGNLERLEKVSIPLNMAEAADIKVKGFSSLKNVTEILFFNQPSKKGEFRPVIDLAEFVALPKLKDLQLIGVKLMNEESFNKLTHLDNLVLRDVNGISESAKKDL